mmetsp:Transcript_13011/g.19720  ORF Transcript_13011/g.19720 Transcript_13011/m.19720 type:complete len:796 (+) Transcript_13011:132-2519(+)
MKMTSPKIQFTLSANKKRKGRSGSSSSSSSSSFSTWTKKIINYQPKNYKISSSDGNNDETAILSSKVDTNYDIDNNVVVDDDKIKNARASFSLSSLINVEALLLANGQFPLGNTTKSETEIEPGSSTAGIRLIKDMINSNSKGNKQDYTSEIASDSSSASASDGNDDVAAAINNIPSSPLSTTMQSIQQNIKDLVEPSPSTSTSSLQSSSTSSLETITPSNNGPRNNFDFPIPGSAEYKYALKEATQSIEDFMNGAVAASTVSPEKLQTLIASASRSLAVDQNADVFKAVMDRVVLAAETLAREQGVDVSDAAAQARATTRYTAEFLQVANGVLVSGYVREGNGSSSRSSSSSSSIGNASIVDSSNGSDAGDRNDQLAQQLNIPPSDDDIGIGRPLFQDFESVIRVPDNEFKSTIEKASDMAVLAGAIYQDTIPKIHQLGHSLVANGTAADVVYMVTDTIGYGSEFSGADSSSSSSTATVVNESPILVRTITIRGFDASDESVDREQLLYQICDAAQVPFGDRGKNLNVHKGLLEVAKEVYKQITTFIDTSGPNSKIVLNGHSIGGSISNLILLLLAEERGADFVEDKILRVFTFGSPPIATLTQTLPLNNDSLYTCPILEACDIRTDMVYGYAQPWDPIVRMFSPIDALYPLIGDLGDDGVSLYASGPPRTLRPITRAILESWSNWPTFRDDYRGVLDQEYKSIGIQHLLMPDTGRYLTDRVVNVNVATFPIDDVLRVSSRDFYSALEMAFPLDTFAISLVPTAVRSFIHHFYPAYTDFADYSTKKKRNMQNLE